MNSNLKLNNSSDNSKMDRQLSQSTNENFKEINQKSKTQKLSTLKEMKSPLKTIKIYKKFSTKACASKTSHLQLPVIIQFMIPVN